MLRVAAVLLLLHASAGAATSAEDQLWLSPVNTGDCVASRIHAERSPLLDAADRRECAREHPDSAKAKACFARVRMVMGREVNFFTDRCSVADYYIGVNGKEYRLRRTTRVPGKPTDFIGSFAGEGITVDITQPRLISKEYEEGMPKKEQNVLDAYYDVRVTVKKGSLRQTFKATLWYGK
ncbi:MAG TPA: hypothetical protein VEK11_24665 [Thermoanaerobaculia bacterium]|nr:hypothetical protein [Thermoanaerobaculia bacterium]